MSAVLAHSSAMPRAREEKNVRYGNDGSLESVDNLLHKLAAKCHKRVSAMGLPMEYNDVLQEMRLSYVKAKSAWKEDGGSLFATYCTTACMNNFNNAIKKMERERKELGLVSENFMCDEGEAQLTPSVQFADPSNEPDYRITGADNLKYNMGKLSMAARHLVARLLEAQQADSQSPDKLPLIAKSLGLQGKELQRVKLEILNTFGVTWH